MKIYRNDSDTIRVGAEYKNGKYIITITKEIRYWAASRTGKAIETDYRTTRKEFNTKDAANRYFLGIKKNNPSLKPID